MSIEKNSSDQAAILLYNYTERSNNTQDFFHIARRRKDKYEEVFVSKIYLSEQANPILVNYLEAGGHELSFVKSTLYTYDSVSSHPDIYMCKIRANKIFHGNPEELGFNYPENIKFNAVVMGKYFIHNFEFTSRNLIAEIVHFVNHHINVPQGYTKCNMAVVTDNAAITSDMGIAVALKTTNIDLLVVTPGHVLLKGQTHGFLGGASGRVGDEMIFHGNLSAHPDFEKISAFMKKHKCKLKYFEEFELEDIGSIIELSI
jgi:hypothetical protein